MLKEAGHNTYPLVTGKDYSHADFMVDSTRAQSPAAVSKSHHGPFTSWLTIPSLLFPLAFWVHSTNFW
jgi:hypothetical protein